MTPTWQRRDCLYWYSEVWNQEFWIYRDDDGYLIEVHYDCGNEIEVLEHNDKTRWPTQDEARQVAEQLIDTWQEAE